MNKYICMSCGLKINNHDLKKIHDEIFSHHRVIKDNLLGRFLDLMTGRPLEIVFRSTGMSIIYFVLLSHFSIEFTILESCLIGVGMGLLL